MAIASRKMDKLERASKKLTAATNGECFYVQADVRQVLVYKKLFSNKCLFGKDFCTRNIIITIFDKLVF